MAMGKLLHLHIEQQISRLSTSGERAGALVGRAIKQRTATADALSAMKLGDSAATLDVLVAQRALVSDEVAFWRESMKDPTQLAASGYSRSQGAAKLAAVESQLAATSSAATTRLAMQLNHLTEEISGGLMWAGTHEDIAHALAHARKLGAVVEIVETAGSGTSVSAAPVTTSSGGPESIEAAAPIAAGPRVMKVVINGETVQFRETSKSSHAKASASRTDALHQIAQPLPDASRMGRDSADVFTIGPVPKSGPARWKFLATPSNWTSERQAIHDQLLTTAKAEALSFADAMQRRGGDPTLYAMRGNTAAGKSRTAKGAIPELTKAMQSTGDQRSVNPDNFKVALMSANGSSFTSAEVHSESSALASRLQHELLNMKTSDGKQAATIMVDKRLATLNDVKEYADIARATDRKFVMYDVDAPLEVSLAGVLERAPGGSDPLPKFDVVADGFRDVRRDRNAVIKFFEQNPDVGSYELFATAANGEKVKVLVINDGVITMLNEPLYQVATQNLKAIAEAFGSTIITWNSVEAVTVELPTARAAAVRKVLEVSIGKTWKEALDAHSTRRMK
jgi:hypothetical protein